MNEAGGLAERSFFQEEFHRRTIVIAVCGGDVSTTVPVIRDLSAADCRVVVIAGGGAGRGERLAMTLEVEPTSLPGTLDASAELWMDLERSGIGVIGVEGDPWTPAAELGGRLGVFKVVLVDPEGGWGKSFASLEDLDTGQVARTKIATAVRRALDGGVGGVNVCRAGDLDTELFTFDGAGTLFTADAYVQVNRLRADDIAVVEQLAARGVAEGFLRPRPRAELVRLALGGLGARVGPSRQLAGFGALETDRYTSTRVAEVTCLYTVNRYAGEGVGGRLVDALVDTARRDGIRAVFACTVSERAASLFERSGFDKVSQSRIPAEKWVGYAPERRQLLSAHWMDLDIDDRAVSELSSP